MTRNEEIALLVEEAVADQLKQGAFDRVPRGEALRAIVEATSIAAPVTWAGRLCQKKPEDLILDLAVVISGRERGLGTIVLVHGS